MNPLARASTFFALYFFALTVHAEIVRTTIVKTINIDAPIEAVFDYATTAANWSEWHPNTLSTKGADDHSATENEQIIETLKFGQLIGPQLFWTVSEHVVPNKWRIEGGDWLGLVHFDLTYTLALNEDGTTHFRRDMIYDMDSNIVGRFNIFAFKIYNHVMSALALTQLKAAIEAGELEQE